MKKSKLAVLILSLLMVVLLAVGMGCEHVGDEPPGELPDPPSNHVCETKCPECGLCIDLDCGERACANKCGDSAFYNAIYAATELKVAKTNVTVNAGGGYIEDFNATGGGSIVYKFSSSEAITASLIVTVGKTAEEDVYTDSVDVIVNDEKISARPSKVPALDDGDNAGTAWAEVALGCISLDEGINEIKFIAKGDGVHAHNFKQIEILGDVEIELYQATEIGHECTSVCEVCDGCTDYTCFNPGCAIKCVCEAGAAAHVFWVFNENVSSNRDVNPELSGVGSTWGQCTTMVFPIYAEEAGTYKYGAVISTEKNERLFTDQFFVFVNGVKVQAGTGYCPKGDSRDWDAYALVIAGEFQLEAGNNIVRIDQDMTGRSNANWGTAYNFQSLVIFTDKNIGWAEKDHSLTHREEVAATCLKEGVKEHWECKDADCGKLFKDEFGLEETTLEELSIPADESKHKWEESLFDDGMFVCETCDTELYNVMDGMSDKVVLENKAGEEWVLGAKETADAQYPAGYIPFKNNTISRVTFLIESDKATEAYLWTYNSAIAGSYKIEYYKTWAVYVNETEYLSETIHHNVAGGGNPTKFYNFKYEFVAKITLVEGVNEIVFVSTGAEACNLINLALTGTDATLELVEHEVSHTLERAELVDATCRENGMKAHWHCTDEGCGKYFTDMYGENEVDVSELVIPADSTKHVWENSGDVYTCSECQTAATVFTTVDPTHVDTNKAAKAGEGIGSSWNIETRFTFYINAEKAGTVLLVVAISQSSNSALLTDLYKIYVNGSTSPLESTTKVIGVGTNKWTTFDYLTVGDIELVAGLNTITFSFTPQRANEGGIGNAHNFLEIAISADDNTVTTHECESECDTCNKCEDLACPALICKEKCYGHYDDHADECESKCELCGKCTEQDCPVPVCSTKCECIEINNFDAMDDKVTNELRSGDEGNYTWAEAAKNTGENCIGGSNGKVNRITFYITSDKDTTAVLWSENSAIASGFNIEYYKTWTIYVNGTEYLSDTIHHNHNYNPSGAANRFANYTFEYVIEIALKEGVNKIEFVSTGKESLNLRSIAITNTDATLEMVSKPEEESEDPGEDPAPEAAVLESDKYKKQ
ncbi:MAG: hypothetical protein J1F39_05755 [Clostridiales bacterium]|nr:hypothetical protein [Clostridiales bacterium]